MRRALADDAGSTTGGVTTVYGWDQANAWRTSQGPSGTPNQVQFTYVKSGATSSNGRMTRYQNSATSSDASYAYDASGQRTKSVVTIGSTATTTSFTYDGLSLLSLAATQGSSTWRLDYLYDEEGTPYGGVYRSPAASSSPTYFTMITSGHGDVVELLDASGAAFASYRYDAWGRPLTTGTSTAATSLISSTLAGQIASRQILRYASYAYDAESGLCYCSARYYDPATRQWTTADSAKADGEESAWQYCAGEPVGNVDPSGLVYQAPGLVTRPGYPGQHCHAFLKWVYLDSSGADPSDPDPLSGRCYVGVMYVNDSSKASVFKVQVEDGQYSNSTVQPLNGGKKQGVLGRKTGCMPDAQFRVHGWGKWSHWWPANDD